MTRIYENKRIESNKEPKPLCGHTDGFCSYTTCRMRYAVKIPKTNVNVERKGREILHMDKVLRKLIKKDIQKLDSEMYDMGDGTRWGIVDNNIQGEFAKRRERIKKYKMMFWKCLLILIGLGVAYPLVVAVRDMFY